MGCTLLTTYLLTYWRHLANTTEPSICCGDAALCQITLTTCFIIVVVIVVFGVVIKCKIEINSYKKFSHKQKTAVTRQS